MKFYIRGENLELTEAIKSYVESKIEKVQKYFPEDTDVAVHTSLMVYKTGQKVEVTIHLPKLVLRAEETNQDVYAAVDIVVDKLERQIRKHKTKMSRKYRERSVQQHFFTDSHTHDEQDEDEISITREKVFTLSEMDAEEAVMRMNMLGHDFFLFIDIHTGQNSLVYRRNEDTYGQIRTTT